MTVKHKPMRHDLTRPAPGKRLMLGTIAAALGITVTDMATATGVSRTAVANIFSNDWPVKTDADAIKARLFELFIERGATDEQAASLFYAQGCGSPDVKAVAAAAGRPAQDGSGRFLDAAGARIKSVNQPDPNNPQEETQMLMAKQTLSRVAMKAFGVFTNPFDVTDTDRNRVFAVGNFALVAVGHFGLQETNGVVVPNGAL